MGFKAVRNMKVYEQTGYRYKSTPTIMLKGQWLKELGCDYGTQICVKCEAGRLTITKADEGEESYVEPAEAAVACVAETKDEYGRGGRK